MFLLGLPCSRGLHSFERIYKATWSSVVTAGIGNIPQMTRWYPGMRSDSGDQGWQEQCLVRLIQTLESDSLVVHIPPVI